MIIGITCSRSLVSDEIFIDECLDNVLEEIDAGNITFITGDAISDFICGRYMEWNNYDVIYLKPAHKLESVNYNVRLYYARNKNVVDNCHVLVSIWDGESRGTKMTTDYAKRNNKKVIEFVKRLEITFHN